MNGLDEVVAAWGVWKARQLGNSCVAAAAIDMSHSALAGAAPCSIGAADFEWLSGPPPGESVNTVYTVDMINGDVVPAALPFAHDYAGSRVFVWSTTRPFSLGAAVPVRAGLPPYLDATPGDAFPLDLSLAADQPVTLPIALHLSRGVQTAPLTDVEMTMQVTRQSVTAPWVATLEIRGQAALALEVPVNGQSVLLTGIGQVIEDVAINGLADIADIYAPGMTGDAAVATARGVFSGAQDVNPQLTTRVVGYTSGGIGGGPGGGGVGGGGIGGGPARVRRG